MNALAALDAWLASLSSAYAIAHPMVYASMLMLATNYIPKTGVLLVLGWGLWFSRDADSDRRAALLLSWIAAPTAAFISRALAATVLPFRARPMDAPDIYPPIPFGLHPDFGASPSSFPSDHAALLSVLACGLVLAHRRWGWIAVAYVLAAGLLPRIFLGFHYLSDVLVGAVLGVGVFGALRLLLPMRGPMRLAECYPGTFYALMFFVCWQITVLFEPLREFAAYIMLIISSIGA